MSEISNENLNLLGKKYKAASMILIAQVIFSIALIATGWFVSANVENSISDESLMSLRIAVIFIAITTFVLRRMLFRWDRLKNVAILKGISGLLGSLQANAIILGTLAEIIAIIGFLIAALGGVRTEMFTFGAVSLILFLINFPRKNIWEKIVANLQEV
jgi:hypothetical protein